MNTTKKPRKKSRLHYIVVVGMLEWGLSTATLFLVYYYLSGHYIDITFVYRCYIVFTICGIIGGEIFWRMYRQ
jgi:hypothetical protein